MNNKSTCYEQNKENLKNTHEIIYHLENDK